MSAAEPFEGAFAPPDELAPRGLVDLRGTGRDALTLVYPRGAVVVVSGLPGSGKSTLLRRWAGTADALVVEPRVAHDACAARMPAWLPYAVYRPWARLRHVAGLREAVGGERPLLVHDCGSRAWLRGRLGWAARRAGRTGGMHLVLLDVTASTALEGQRDRGRYASRRTFARHAAGLGALLEAVSAYGPAAVPGVDSVVLLDRSSRERPMAVRFAAVRP